jgi:hypothetical protein
VYRGAAVGYYMIIGHRHKGDSVFIYRSGSIDVEHGELLYLAWAEST